MENQKIQPGVGLDAGTSYYISARSSGQIKKQHNAFLSLEGNSEVYKRQLKRMNISSVELNNRIHIVGENAFSYAQIFGSKDLRRLMKDGLLNPTERDALPILRVIIKDLIGEPLVPEELCVYSVPATPIDKETLVDYHEDVLGQIVEGLGFKAFPIKEAVALAYHGLVNDSLTGISLSFGGGMCNAAVLYAGMDAINFSVARGGVWIDKHVSLDTGVPQAKVQYLKESGELDLSSTKVSFEGGKAKVSEYVPQTQVHQAIRSYYGVLITYILNNISKQFLESKNMPSFPNPIPIAIGGGTALVPGFVDLFKEKLEQSNFPIEISEINLVDSAHEGVALGALNDAILAEEK